MSCNDCQDQIFELIEREAIDPDGVRAILEKCPECQELFDEMKAALKLTASLPGEEPPAAIDASIVRAAAARKPRQGATDRRWLQAPPWAMAAVALLVVGVGVWVVPRTEEAEPAEPPPAELVQAELRPASVEEDTGAGASLRASGPASGTVALAEAEVPPVDRAKVERRAPTARAKRQAKASAEQASHDRASGEQAFGEQPSTDRAAADEASGLVAAEAPAAPLRRLSAECAARIARIEQRGLDNADAEVEPEEALAIGRCYQAAGDERAARKWLRRAAAHPETESRARRALRKLADR
ncbi:MAG: hypothetical protein AMJ62_09670 [Myxococcales bacterium SG8_38]|nr:MAG: hypothetical protein AMJ62_09670 [Myxococcales bacterium SG8_38]